MNSAKSFLIFEKRISWIYQNALEKAGIVLYNIIRKGRYIEMTETDKMITPEEALPTPADLFHKGMNFTSYDFLGVHGSAAEDGYAYTFRVWAPNAEAVTLNADFTDWKNGLPMIRESEKGLWSVRVESRESLEGRFYKYAVTGKNGVTHVPCHKSKVLFGFKIIF